MVLHPSEERRSFFKYLLYSSQTQASLGSLCLSALLNKSSWLVGNHTKDLFRFHTSSLFHFQIEKSKMGFAALVRGKKGASLCLVCAFVFVCSTHTHTHSEAGSGRSPKGLRAQIHVKMLPHKLPPWLTAFRLNAAANGKYH